jgi:predicted DCC family thiol-disulfide oxidoreductase YuxK
MDGRLLVLYDDDCGFCRWSADRLLAWDRGGRLRAGAIQGADQALAAVPAEARLREMHVVEPDGRVWSGGRALTRVAAELPGGAPFAWLGRRAPAATARLYRAVAARRDRLGALLGTTACAVDPAAR